MRCKTGKFCLQWAKAAIIIRKNEFRIVNFLKIRFVRRVNFGVQWEFRKDFFRIVFLDIRAVLCYYIIYIWENSAQNRPIGGVLFDPLARSHLVKSLFTRARPPMQPDRAGASRAPEREQTKTSTGKKLLILAGGNAHEKQNFHKTALLSFGNVVSCEQRRNRC